MADSDGRNPFGECAAGHQYFRGGCPSCMADMVLTADQAGIAVANETHIIREENP